MTAKPRPSLRDAWRDLTDAVKTPANGTAPKTAPPTDDALSDAAQAADYEATETPAVIAPVKRKWSTLPAAVFKGKDGQLQLYPDGVDHLHGVTKATIPLASIQSVTIEDGAALESRITATRLLLVGVFALALRKRKGGEKYLTIESTDAFTVVEVDRKSIGKAQKFAAQVRTAMKGAAR